MTDYCDDWAFAGVPMTSTKPSMDARDFVVTYDPKDNDRHHDWVAVQPNWVHGMPVGTGRTRDEAIFALLDQLLQMVPS